MKEAVLSSTASAPLFHKGDLRHILISALLELYIQERPPMVAAIFSVLNGFDRFQAWFDRRFGWFFTNGMKQVRAKRMHALKA